MEEPQEAYTKANNDQNPNTYKSPKPKVKTAGRCAILDRIWTPNKKESQHVQHPAVFGS